MAGQYDIAVLGASAAGYVAAIQLAAAGRRVVLVEAPGVRTESPLADWVPADVLRVCPPLRAVRGGAVDWPFRAVHFHSVEMDRHATYRARGPAGYVLRADRLRAALARAARRAGVERMALADPLRPDIREAGLHLPGARPATAAVLLIAQQRPREVFSDLALPLRTPPAGRAVCGLDVPVTPAQARRLDKDLHVVAFPASERLGMFFAARGLLHVRILYMTAPAGGDHAGAAGLSRLVGKCQQAALLPARLDLTRAAAAVWHPPGGAALELETHLAKRTLLVGTAGGFTAAMSAQTIDPGARSAMIAAAVAEKALASGRVQDVLAEYDHRWRDSLADRIRPLSTTLQMLLPMVFTNKAMTARFARALLYGEGI